MIDDIKFVYRIAALLRAWGKAAFIRSLPPNSKVMDVGCGNRSPKRFKMLRPDLFYIGLDVGDYNQSSPREFADEYTIVQPALFAAEISKYGGKLDAVVSAHNIEHCNEPDLVLDAMLKAIKPGGRCYLSFPCEASVGFPERRGCLNFYDDASHLKVPNWEKIISKIRSEGFVIDFSAQRYRPIIPALIGLLGEPFGALTKRQMPVGSTWALYGFESVIWASRLG